MPNHLRLVPSDGSPRVATASTVNPRANHPAGRGLRLVGVDPTGIGDTEERRRTAGAVPRGRDRTRVAAP